MATDNTGRNIYRGAPAAGINNVGSYQAAGIPFITGSILTSGDQHTISFPYVTKKVTVIASGSITEHIRVHFHPTGSQNRVGDHPNGTFISLDSHEDAMEFDVRCKEIYMSAPAGASGGYRIYASLTGIPTGSMFALSGSGVTE